MGIPHFEDLDLDTLLDIVELRWTACEKMDGSYMEFGLDKHGRFFTRRKNGTPCYTIDDWPDEGWTNSFRAAHVVAEEVADFLVERAILRPKHFFMCEVMWGDRPNTVIYPNTASLIIHSWSYSADVTPVQFMLKDFSTSVSHSIYHSYDAKTKQLKPARNEWNILVQEPINSSWIWARMKPYAATLKKQLIGFRDELIQGVRMSRGDLLKVKLNQRPGFVFPDRWPAVKAAVKDTRAEWQKRIVPELQVFRNLCLRALIIDQQTGVIKGSQFSEGLVVTTWQRNICKFVDREGFSQANAFSHWVKYALAGGRRTKRPSFLSRTAGWPVEKRLERLDVLRERYLRNHHKLHKEFSNAYKLMPVSYDRELHERTKLLFVDVRERIKNGR
jgi:hypothetical protein